MITQTDTTIFMRKLEERFQLATKLPNRAHYKIFYGQVRPAPILTLGINPGGAPSNTASDGRTHKDGVIAAASASFFENDEHDVLDCNWRENSGLRAVLTPLVGGDTELIRQNVVKTNMAFHRSAKKSDINIDTAMDQTKPFLSEIIGLVRPSMVLLTGVPIREFNDRYASDSTVLAEPERDSSVKQIVFAASKSRLLKTGEDVYVIQLAHASQFGWTYGRYKVAERIAQLGFFLPT